MYVKNPEYFLTVIREGSISKAAEALYLSQPYLSQCIARLERELGVKLFDRSHMPLTLTEAGRLYQQYLESVGVLTGKFESRLEEVRTGKRRPLNVGTTPWRGSVLLPDILPEYTRRNPDVEVVLHEYHSGQLVELLRNDRVDFCLMNLWRGADDLVYDTVLAERMLLVASREHPAVQGIRTSVERPAHIDVTSLKGEKFILLPEDQVMGDAMKNLFLKLGMSDCDILYTSSSTTAANLAAQGFGLTFLPEGGTRHTAHVEKLAFFTVDQPPFAVPLLILYKKNGFLTPQAREFVVMVKRYYEAMYPAGR